MDENLFIVIVCLTPMGIGAIIMVWLNVWRVNLFVRKVRSGDFLVHKLTGETFNVLRVKADDWGTNTIYITISDSNGNAQSHSADDLVASYRIVKNKKGSPK